MSKSASKPRPYTDVERARLLAPIVITTFGGKSWGGRVPYATLLSGAPGRRRNTEGDRYGNAADWSDLDGVK